MYLSCLQFEHIKTQSGDISNPYNLHKAIWKAFPNMDGQARDFLYRAEQNRDKTKVLVLSANKPIENRDTSIQTKTIEPALVNGRRYIFNLRANPIKRLSKERVRVPILNSDEAYSEWLQRKFDGAAKLIDFTVLNCKDLDFRKGTEWGRLRTVDFQGTIICEDNIKLLSLFKNGIGPAKGFGCGMLLLKNDD